MTWLTMNDADTEAASKTKLMERVPLMELKVGLTGSRCILDLRVHVQGRILRATTEFHITHVKSRITIMFI